MPVRPGVFQGPAELPALWGQGQRGKPGDPSHPGGSLGQFIFRNALRSKATAIPPSHYTGRHKHLDWPARASGQGTARGWKRGGCPCAPGSLSALPSWPRSIQRLWWLPEPRRAEGSPASTLHGGVSSLDWHVRKARGSTCWGPWLQRWGSCADHQGSRYALRVLGLGWR